MIPLRSPFSAGFGDSAALDLACALKVLAEPNRLKILALLRSSGPMTGVEIEQYLTHLAQPTISHHLRVLDEAGLISTHREKSGVAVRRLVPDRMRVLATLLNPGGGR